MITIDNIKPLPGKIIVKKLPDQTTTAHGIVLPSSAPINKRHEYVEVVATGKNISNDMRLKIEVGIGDRCLVLGKGIYDSIKIDEELYYIINPADIYAIVE